MCENTLLYNTRDGKGNDIQKEIEFKTYKTILINYTCPLCNNKFSTGIKTKDIVSTDFTDWQYMGDYTCIECSKLFTLYRYSYIIDNNQIRLLNIREMVKEIQKPQKPPFKIVISISQKKHLFMKAKFNNNANNFIANLEEEQIYCDIEKIKEQFLFIGSLQALGESKQRLKNGEIRFDILQKVGLKALDYLKSELKTRQMQIPLYLSQKLEISEEEAICNLDLILKI